MKLPFAGRLLAVALFTAASFSLPLAHADASTPKVGLVMKSLANEFFVTMTQGAEDYQKQHPADFELISNGIKNETDTQGQIDIINQMIIAKVDGLVIAPADSKALIRAIEKARDAGIVVVNIDNQLDPKVLKKKQLDVPFVGPDNRAGARKVGEYLARKLNAGDEVAIIEGVSTTTNAQQRTAGFKDAMKAAQIKVVSVQSGNWEIEGGNKQAAAILSEYPNVKALLAGNDSMAIGAVSAIRAAGKAGKVQVVGYDNIDAIKPMLKNGRVLATADQAAAQQAVFGIQTALKLIKNEPVDALKDGVIATPVELITTP